MRINSVGKILKYSVFALGLSHSSPAVAKIAEKAQFATKPIEQKFIARSNTTTALVNNVADRFEHVQIAQNRSSGVKRVAGSPKSAATHKNTQAKLRVPSFSNTKRIGESKKAWIYEFTNYSNFDQADTTKFNRVTWAVSKTNPNNRISRYDFKPVEKKWRSLVFNDSTRTLFLDGKDGYVSIDEIRYSNNYSVTINNDAGMVLKKSYSTNKKTGEVENLKRSIIIPDTGEELIIEKDYEYNAAYKAILKKYDDLLNINAPDQNMNELWKRRKESAGTINEQLDKMQKELDKVEEAEEKAAMKDSPKYVY